MNASANGALLERAQARCETLLEGEPDLLAVVPSDAAMRQLLQAPACIEAVRTACRLYADRPCLRWRSAHTAVHTLTFGDLARRVDAFACGLGRAGLAGSGSFVGINGFGSADWVVADLACLQLGAVSVPLPGGAAELRAIVAGVDLACVVSDGPVSSELPVSIPVIRMGPDGGWTMARIEALGREAGPVPPPVVEPQGSDPLRTILYTSGSTGEPKGALFPESVWIEYWRDPLRGVLPTFPAVRLACLPLGHVAGRRQMQFSLMTGGLTCFPSRTDLSTLFQDFAAFRPTVLMLVPQLARLIHQHYQAERRRGVGDERAAEQQMRETMGGRLLLIMTGSAPVEPEVTAFLRGCLEVPVLEGYATTETGILTVDGRLTAGVREVRIVDVPDLGFRATDLPYPRGELCVKTRAMVPGYLRDPEASAALFDEEGFLRTGDIVAVHGPREVVWLERKNDTIKLQNGRFVAMARLERLYAGAPLVGQIYVYASGQQACVLAVVVPAAGAPRAEDARGEAALRLLLLDELRGVALVHGLPAHEVLRDILVEPLPFTEANGLLTSTGKLARRRLRDAYGARLELLYQAIAARQDEALPPIGEPDRGAHALLEAGVGDAVRRAVAVTLGVRELRDDDLDRSFRTLGLDSLLLLRLRALLVGAFGRDLPATVAFDHPTPNRLASALALSLGRSPERAVIAPSPRDPSCLAPGQASFLFLHRRHPASSVYNVLSVTRMRGPLDHAALRRAIRTVMERHDILRTVYSERGGQIYAEPTPDLPPDLPLVDLRAAPDAEQEAQRVADALGRRPFDLFREIPIRAAVIALADDLHLLVITQHHIVTDPWSARILLREVAEHYHAFLANSPARLPPPALQFADFAAWSRRWARGPAAEADRVFWRRRLADLPALALPTARTAPRTRTHRGSAVPFVVPPEITTGLDVVATQHGSTRFHVLVAGFAALLHRWTGQLDFGVGTLVTRRDAPELADLVGYLGNTVVLRCDVTGDPTFDVLLSRVHAVTLEALGHARLPFDEVVRALDASRASGLNPLVQACFSMVSRPPLDLGAMAAAWSPQPQSLDGSLPGGARFDLCLVMAQVDDALHGVLEYSLDLFDAEVIERMAGHFQALLRAVVGDPRRPVGLIPMLSAAERRAVLGVRSRPGTDATPDMSVRVMFEAQVDRTPDAVALEFAGERLTYAALDARANGLAHALRALGVGPEARVGLYVGRSLEMVIGLLGILKAGGAYVPLDPDHPPDRLAWVRAHAGLAVIVTDRSLARPLTTDGVPQVFTDAAGSTDRAGAPSEPGHLAYVVYTSGSTGRPKGVMVSHAAVVNVLRSFADALAMTPQDVLLAVTTISFDIAGLEILLPLITGARVHIAPRRATADGAALATLLREARATVMQATPASWRLLLEGGWQGSPGLRILVGGEALPGELARTLARRGERVFNAYGPTEATIWASLADVGVGCLDPLSPAVSIGHAVAHTGLYVLDRLLQPVPAGVVGELYIGGVQLGRGYLGRPDLTADRFVPDPFGRGERLYRTGDRCRQVANGALEFVGRSDLQVKVRGFRVELGEIEAALSAHAGVRACVVVASEDPAGGRRLVAYVVGDAPGPELRRSLRARLPEYMVPAAIVALPALPLTPNGKVDRAALPAAEGEAAGGEAARTPEEAILQEIWQDVLGRAVGVRDDFFDVGGHSLLAMQVVARMREMLNVEVPVRALFEAPTIAALAAWAGGAVEAGPRPGAGEGEFPLSFAQERLWFLDQLEPNGTTYTIPVVVRLDGTVQEAALGAALRQLVARHAVLRTTLVGRDGSPVQRVGPVGPWTLAVVDVPASAVAARARQEVTRPFDLAVGPLFRATLLRDGEGGVLVLALHHIVADGWSLDVLWRDLGALYAAAVAGREAWLPTLPVQYADYAVWQRAAGVPERERAYWRTRLADATPLALPTDRPRPAMPSRRGEACPVRLAPAEVAALRGLGRTQGATLFMTVLAVFEVLLSRYAGQDDVCVGTPIAGRTHREIEDLVGFFTNTLVLRTDLGGEPTFLEVVARVREAALGAYAHAALPFERLVADLGVARDTSRNPLFQVMFVLADAGTDLPGLGGLRAERLPVRMGVEKFDLTLSLERDGQGLVGSITYSVDLFDAATIARMVGHFGELVRGIVADPHRPVGRLPILTEAERHALGARPSAAAADTCLHTLVEVQADRTPDAVALEFEGRALTYAQLDARANQLAHALRARGVGPEVPVGLCLARSPELVVGLLGILKAGGAYVPLDPKWPSARLALVAADAGLALLVGDPWPGASLTVVPVDAPGERTRLPPSAAPDNIAYVMYTSGSTGRPKGVAVPHRAIVTYLSWATAAYAGSPGSVVHSSFAFDLTLTGIFVPLVTGSRVHLVPEGVGAEPLAEALTKPGLGLVKLTPAHLEALAGLLNPEAAAGCARTFVIGGEALRWQTLCFWRRSAPDLALVNEYGPTEAAVGCCVYRVDPTEEGSGRSVPIGRPTPGTHLYILDGRMQPVPQGATGELWIGGDQLSRGYVGRPDLTAERFVPDPFGAGARIYRTGDLCRQRPDGLFEYLGRADDQVKIRGYRIELGEIEATLLAHPGVRACVVLPFRDGADGHRVGLVAYVVGDAAPEALREHLSSRLPAYMVPAAVRPLSALPLTPQGKVDRAALPPPEVHAAPAGSDVPQAPIELMLAAIWSAVLHLPEVGLHENFFELGGDSILAIQVVAQARSAGIELRVRQIFENQTLATLSRIVQRAEPEVTLERPAPPPRDGPELEQLRALVCGQDIEAIHPLSPLQDGLLFHTLNDIRPGSYVVQLVWTVDGPLHPAAFQQALACVLARHPTLRTGFAVSPSPRQVVLRRVEPVVYEADLRGAAEVDAALEDYLEKDRVRSFDLACPPLLRFAIFRTGAQAHRLVMTNHHLVLDGWSVALLLRDLWAFYHGSVLPEAPPYPAYLAWLAQQSAAAASPFWRRELAGFAPPKSLATGRARAVGQQFGRSRLFLSPDIVSFAHRNGLTPSVVLQGAWALLCGRYGGTSDVLFGLTVSGRTAPVPGIGEMVGLFVNTVPNRIRIDETEPLSAWLHTLQRHQAALEEHGFCSLGELQRLTDVPSGTWLFESLFVFENYPAPPPGASALTFSRPRVHEETGYPLTLLSTQGDVTIQYDRALFDAPAIARIGVHFCALLRGMVDAPDGPVGALRMLPEAEQFRLTVEWNATDFEPGAVMCLHTLFEAQADRTPTAVAVEFEGAQLTYWELDDRSNHLARVLRARGVGPEVCVGVCAERSLELMVGLLAILKAGGAYVPLDPTHPPFRLMQAIQATRAPIVLTQERFRSRVDGLPSCVALVLPSAGSASRLPLQTNPQNLAYVLFTSGSTGAPKGVMVPHRGVVNYLHARQRLHPLGPGDRVIQKTPFTFDVSVWELFLPLAFGARVVLAAPGAQADPGRIDDLVIKRAATVLHFVPSMLDAVLGAVDIRRWRSLTHVYVSGEALALGTAERLLRSLPAVRLVNLYGPTEAAIDVSSWDFRAGFVAIGRPMGNTRLYLLDHSLRVVPVGVAGELWIGGPQLARGYAGRPGLTAERFLPSPFAPGERLYRTGDICRYAEGGEIEYVGRSDSQVKLRGFRIEPGEIEAALSTHPAVEACAIVAAETAGVADRLVAYVVGPARPPALREHLRARLPDYMVPSVFVSLEALPRTPNGKLDRTALPAPDPLPPGVGFVAPRTPAERALCDIWSLTLAVDRIGIHDDFFGLGGHSLLAIRAVSLVSEALGVRVRASALFEAPTVAAFAERLSGAPDEATQIFADAILPPDLQPLPAGSSDFRKKRIFLTGATGFVGAFQVAEFLRDPGVELTCLVRAGDDGAALRRVLATLESWDLEVDASRIRAVAGDLIASRLGLSVEAWGTMAGTHDAVVHAGADVNHLVGYAGLRAANVGALLEVLRFAATGRPKRVCLVSTLSVFDGGGDPETGIEPPPSVGGYARSKWVADRLACLGRSRGFDVVICRPPLVLGDTERGRLPRDRYWFTQTLRAALRIGALPDLPGWSIPAIPVDIVTRVIREATLNSSHSVNLEWEKPITLAAICAALGRVGSAPRCEPPDAWLDGLRTAAAADPMLQLARLPFEATRSAGPPAPEASPATVDLLVTVLSYLSAAGQPSFPMTPIQRWFVEQDLEEPHHWNQAVMLDARVRIDPMNLSAALEALAARHPMLRVRTAVRRGGTRQWIAGAEACPLVCVDLSGVLEGELAAVVARATADAQASLNLARGPAWRVLLLDGGGAPVPTHLLLVVHHWAVDAYSWRILVRDLELALSQQRAGVPITLAPAATPFAHWSERLASHARSAAYEGEIGYWSRQLQCPVLRLPTDHQLGPVTVGTSASFSCSLSPALTLALSTRRGPSDADSTREALIAALGLVVCRWVGGAVRVDVEGHGREDLFQDLDISGTVGWFTSMFPVVLDFGVDASPAQALAAARATLGAVPSHGIGFGLLEYLHGGAPLGAETTAEICVNYLGTLHDATVGPAGVLTASSLAEGPFRSPRGRRPHLLDVVGKIADGALHITWVYATTRHRSDTIERLARSHLRALGSIAQLETR